MKGNELDKKLDEVVRKIINGFAMRSTPTNISFTKLLILEFCEDFVEHMDRPSLDDHLEKFKCSKSQ